MPSRTEPTSAPPRATPTSAPPRATPTSAPPRAAPTSTSTEPSAIATPAVRVRGLVRTYPHPDGGTFDAVAGLDVTRHPEQVKRRIGVQLQASSYFEHLTLREILVLFGSFYPSRRDPDELLELVGLLEKRRSLVSQLSGGQAQRFSIVAALVNDPEVVFLDEPTTGLDPQARRHLWDLVRAIHREGRTVVLTTHYMEEAQALADRVAIMDHGRLIALDTPAGHVAALARDQGREASTEGLTLEDVFLARTGGRRRD